MAMTRKRNKNLGNCFEIHCRSFVFGLGICGIFEEGELLLCQGDIYHHEIGWHEHCWLELAGVVVLDISNGNNYAGLVDVYYRLSQAKNVQRFTREEAQEKMMQTGIWGDWRDKAIGGSQKGE